MSSFAALAVGRRPSAETALSSLLPHVSRSHRPSLGSLNSDPQQQQQQQPQDDDQEPHPGTSWVELLKDVQDAVAEAAANRKKSDQLEAEAGKGVAGVVNTDESYELVSNSEAEDPPGENYYRTFHNFRASKSKS